MNKLNFGYFITFTTLDTKRGFRKMNNKQLIKELKNGKNLEVTLPQYANELLTSYHKFSIIRFTLEYFTHYQVICDNENKEIDQISDLNKELNDIIQEVIFTEFSGNAREQLVKRLESLRNTIIKKVTVLTTYTDVLQIYEHVLNRIEYRFVENYETPDYMEFADLITEYIFSSKDNVMINHNIKEIISELPVRMTKSKFYEIINESLSVYKGFEKESFDNYLLVLRSSAMSYQPEGMEEYFPELKNLMNELQSVSYKDINQDTYQLLFDKVEKAAVFLGNTTDAYVNLQEIVNNLYAMVLTFPYAFGDHEKDVSICKDIIKVVYDNFKNEVFNADIEDAVKGLSLIEGRQETIFSQYLLLETVLSDVKTSHVKMIDSLMLRNQYDCLSMVQSLLSSSIFINLNKNVTNEIVEEKYLQQESKKLLNDFSELFSKNEQIVNRSVIAHVINTLPVFFHSTDEVINYIHGVLTSCHDEAEKYASYQIIMELMQMMEI